MIVLRSSYNTYKCLQSFENEASGFSSVHTASYLEVRVVPEVPDSQPLGSPALPSLLPDLENHYTQNYTSSPINLKAFEILIIPVLERNYAHLYRYLKLLAASLDRYPLSLSHTV